MGSAISILATLVAGAAAVSWCDGSTLTASLASAADLTSRIDPHYDLGHISDPARATYGGLHNIKSKSSLAELSNRSGKSLLSRSVSFEPIAVDDDSQHYLTVRTLKKASTSSSGQVSSESWSGASSGVKRKLDQQLLQDDLRWGESKARADAKGKAKPASNSQLDTPEKPDRSSKRLKVSTKSTSGGSREAPSLTKSTPRSRSSGRNQSGSDARGRAPGPKKGQIVGAPRAPPGQGSRTEEQRRRRAARQQELREEHKRKIKAGDSEALQKKAELNARRRELSTVHRGHPPPQPKASEAERAASRAKTARYRARQKGLLQPIEFKTSPEERQRSREKQRKARARQRSSTQASEELSSDDVAQKTGQQPKRRSSIRSGSRRRDTKSPSEDEWRSGKSETPEPSLSISSGSDKADSRSPIPALPDLFPSTRLKSPASRNPTSSGEKGWKPREQGAAFGEPQSSSQKADASRGRNSPEVASVRLPRQSKSVTNSPTHSIQAAREQPAQQLQLHAPMTLPDVPLSLLSPPPSGRQHDSLPGLPRLGSIGNLETPSLMPFQNHPSTQVNNVWNPLPLNDGSLWHTTPPLSPLSFGSMRSLDFLHSSNPGSPKH